MQEEETPLQHEIKQPSSSFVLASSWFSSAKSLTTNLSKKVTTTVSNLSTDFDKTQDEFIKKKDEDGWIDPGNK